MFNQKSRFRNFSNLYSMNRGENAGDKLAGELSEEEGHFNKAKNAAEARWASGDIASGNDVLERAKGKAREISDRADAFNPAVAARKQGLAGQAAGVASFYGGQTSEANTQNLQRFRNLYSTVAGMQGRAIPAPNPKGFSVDNSPRAPRALTRQQDEARTATANNRIRAAAMSTGKVDSSGNPLDGLIDNKNFAGRGKVEIAAINTLDGLLKSEKITLDEYYRAQSSPEFYKELMERLGRVE